MKSLTRLFAASTLLACLTLAQFLATTPASAITVELANKCRELALKAYPPQRAGTKSGSAGEARQYYNGCVANGGSPPDDKGPKPAAAPAR